VIVTVALGLVAIPFSITELDLTSKVIISVVILLSVLGGALAVFLRSMHFKQDSLWELYTFICLDHHKKIDALQYNELISLQNVIAKIQRSESLQKKSYDKLVSQARGIIEHNTHSQMDP
jgi:hypothetical protein